MNIIPKKRSYRYHFYFLLFIFSLYVLHAISGGNLFDQTNWAIPILFCPLLFSLYYLRHLSFATLRLFFLTSIFSFVALINEPFAYPIESLVLLSFALISLWLEANTLESKDAHAG